MTSVNGTAAVPAPLVKVRMKLSVVPHGSEPGNVTWNGDALAPSCPGSMLG